MKKEEPVVKREYPLLLDEMAIKVIEIEAEREGLDPGEWVTSVITVHLFQTGGHRGLKAFLDDQVVT